MFIHEVSTANFTNETNALSGQKGNAAKMPDGINESYEL